MILIKSFNFKSNETFFKFNTNSENHQPFVDFCENHNIMIYRMTVGHMFNNSYCTDLLNEEQLLKILLVFSSDIRSELYIGRGLI